MTFNLLSVIISVFLLQLVTIGSSAQANRSTSGCSVPLCPARPSANSSCLSNNQSCYAYQVPLTNQTFCAPSVSCSLFDPCVDDVACPSNTTICLSSACCPRPICMPISLGVINCNAVIPTILPVQCYNHVVNSDPTRNVFYGQSSSTCDSSEFSSSKWVRFSGAAGLQLTTSAPSMNRCGTNSPGYLNDTHPTGSGETKISTVCFNSYSTCTYRTTIMVTNCINYFVYYLSSPPSCNLRYCTV